MIDSLMQFYQAIKEVFYWSENVHVNTKPGICTTHHLIGTMFSYIPVRIFSYKQ